MEQRARSRDGEMWISDRDGLAVGAIDQMSRPSILTELRSRQLSNRPWVQGNGVWSWRASERISVIAEQAKWSHETWQSEIAPAVTANEVWGVVDRRLVGGLIGDAWSSPQSSFIAEMEIDLLWSSGELLWWLADQRLWRSSSLLAPSSEVTLGYAPLAGAWRGARGDGKGGLYLWGEDGLSTVALELTPSWRLSEPSLGSEPLEAEINNLDPTSVRSVFAWLRDEPIDGPSEEIPSDAIDLLGGPTWSSIVRCHHRDGTRRGLADRPNRKRRRARRLGTL